jgi:hypothetical protein
MAALPGAGAGMSSATAGSGVAAVTEASTPGAVPAPTAPVPPAATPPAWPAAASAAVPGSAAGSEVQSEAQTASSTPNEPAKASITRVSATAPVADAFAAEPAAHKVVSGPGYSIAVVGGAAPAVSREAAARNVPVEHRHEPIVCQGGRLMHIDNKNLEFDGDALAAEDGCDLQITNSRIAAQGIGVLARAARVHIENSAIEGEASSIEASEGAQVYVQSSTFKGVIRRADSADFHDLGGNVGN